MMEIGQHKDAAKIFERLARDAEDRGRSKVAHNLYFQAGRASLLAGEAGGAELLEHGLAVLAGKSLWPTLARACHRIFRELEQLGYPELLSSLSEWSTTVLPNPISHYLVIGNTNANLPLKCPDCAGVLHPGDIEMLDETYAECPFCGSTIQGV